MSILSYNNSKFSADINLTKRTGTKVTLNTNEQYVPANIELTLSAQQATPAFDGGAITSTSALIQVSNATVSTTTNSSNITIMPKAQSARTAVCYNGAVNGWVNASDDAVVIAADSEEWNGSTYYLNGVNLPVSSSFSITTPDSNIYGFSTDSNGAVTLSGITNGDEVRY